MIQITNYETTMLTLVFLHIAAQIAKMSVFQLKKPLKQVSVKFLEGRIA